MMMVLTTAVREPDQTFPRASSRGPSRRALLPRGRRLQLAQGLLELLNLLHIGLLLS